MFEQAFVPSFEEGRYETGLDLTSPAAPIP
jgi:hypothetical protein